jgi:hypothetical protein
MHMLEHMASSPSVDDLNILVGSAARIVLCMALAYFFYGFMHMLEDFVSGRNDKLSKFIHKTCRIVLDLLIYAIAGLYGLEYILMKGGAAI